MHGRLEDGWAEAGVTLGAVVVVETPREGNRKRKRLVPQVLVQFVPLGRLGFRK